MPRDKIEALGLFVCGVVVVAGSLLAIVIRGFAISHEKQAQITERLESLRTRKAPQGPAAGIASGLQQASGSAS
jgi:hypothetical protein